MLNRYWYSLLFFFLVLTAVVVSCRHTAEPNPGQGGNTGGTGGTGSNVPCDPNKVYFRQQVLPVLVSNCSMSGCHDVASHQDGVILTSYERVMATGGVRPGRPFDSDLYKVLVDSDPNDRMPQPPASPLTAQQIQLIRNWIEQGAQDLVCQSLCDSNSFTYTNAIRNIISNKCQGCHNTVSAQGSVDLSTYNGVKARVLDGKLWGSVNHLAGFFPMPKNGAKLSDCEIIQIRKWIDAGSPNN